MSTTNESLTTPRPSTILIVDDDLEMLPLCAVKLEANGFFDNLKNVSPRMHGDKLVAILRTKRPLTPIMLISASWPWKLGGRGMAGVLRQYPFLQKPFTGDLLLEKVRAILAGTEPAKP